MAETAVLGGGCFWCLDAVYRQMRGIISSTPGYAGGATTHPTYQQVCSGQTGHAEVVLLEYDPAILDYRQILESFFVLHDPTTLNRQGHDVGTQYRSVIFYTSEHQRDIAQEVIQTITDTNVWGARPVTQLLPLDKFWPAEPEHHNYYAQHPNAGYCQAVIAPKLAKARQALGAWLQPEA
ncbi:peptide-methionine (S)-S-oxide reductase MsrA [Acetobacter lambici]|uniref:Peptide methionine sulfoxide reductase MsrA n=1 Tax=Acetobacter lambici TaxID=1332824 RepID=A0ABT1EVL1_9PROT|nr:peptide-methionine (S)-S-oxide reductase MsrA [Acetobacter lambici]MCP1241344.1 peptide-methionine (S)-S-oxide reductase MsrA [Acetobacter lambici]MCP1256986.1 peptide-methionine (S)-S-oxide reductase MsrA [Acetobacter lambici]NHO55479.1 peptide-methionine (S)-S-oxide reductase MsrA [Acetobacter lambici]